MLHVGMYRVRDDQVERLREWMHELGRRRDEVLETFAAETTRHEVAYLLRGKDSPILIYVGEMGDLEQGRKAFHASLLPIDVEHRRVLAAVLAGNADAEPIRVPGLIEGE
jgi:hypothetical protein